MTLKIGDHAPDFSLLTDQEKTISLKDLQGKKAVFFFYPKDNTPGCTQEACDFRDFHGEFEKLNTQIFGISKDSAASHQKFKQKYTLPFPLLVDKNGEMCEAYGVFKKKSLFGKTFLGIQRSTFLIDENGIILAIWRNVKVKGHIDEVLNELRNHQAT